MIRRFLLLLSINSLFLFGFAPALASASCANPTSSTEAIKCGSCDAAGQTNCDKASPTKSLGDTLTQIINILSAIVGVIAVIMIIIGGLRFITSAGNPENIRSARNTLLYAVIGLIIVALAQLIVHFVINRINAPATPSTPSSGSPTTNPRGGGGI